MQSNSDDGGTKVSNIYQNKQLNTDVEKNYALQDDIFGNADACAGQSSEIGKDEKNKKMIKNKKRKSFWQQQMLKKLHQQFLKNRPLRMLDLLRNWKV